MKTSRIDNDKEIIKSVQEAFSMQPQRWYVGETKGYPPKVVKIATITLEIINIPVCGDPYDYRFYVGRDESGNKLFQIRADSATVEYFPI